MTDMRFRPVKPWQAPYEVWLGRKLIATPADREAALRVLSWYPKGKVVVCHRKSVTETNIRRK